MGWRAGSALAPEEHARGFEEASEALPAAATRRDAFRARQKAKRDILKKNAATAGRALKDLASTHL